VFCFPLLAFTLQPVGMEGQAQPYGFESPVPAHCWPQLVTHMQHSTVPQGGYFCTGCLRTKTPQALLVSSLNDPLIEAHSAGMTKSGTG
jgi:hypothetical protein